MLDDEQSSIPNNTLPIAYKHERIIEVYRLLIKIKKFVVTHYLTDSVKCMTTRVEIKRALITNKVAKISVLHKEFTINKDYFCEMHSAKIVRYN